MSLYFYSVLFGCIDRTLTPSHAPSKGARKSFAMSPPMDFGSQSTDIIKTPDNIQIEKVMADPVSSQILDTGVIVKAVKAVVPAITRTPTESSGVGSCQDSSSVTMDEAYSSLTAGQTPTPAKDPLAIGIGCILFCLFS